VDHLFLIRRHLEPMLEIAASLGDDLVNEVPGLPGANSAYQIVFHCCGMFEWWTREAILGIDVGRDRAAEFEAAGTVELLRRRVRQVVAQFDEDEPRIDLDAPLRDGRDEPFAPTARNALLHVLEELAQHHGQLELTRDLLADGPARGLPGSRSR